MHAEPNDTSEAGFSTFSGLDHKLDDAVCDPTGKVNEAAKTQIERERKVAIIIGFQSNMLSSLTCNTVTC